MSNIHCTELHPGSALLRSRTSNSGKEQGPCCKGDYKSHLQVLGLWNSLEGGCISNRATINYALHGRKPKRSLKNKAKDVVVMAKHDHIAAWLLHLWGSWLSWRSWCKGGFHSSVSLGNPQCSNAPEFSQQSSERESRLGCCGIHGHSTCVTLNPGIRTGLNFPRETPSVVQKMPMSLLQARKQKGNSRVDVPRRNGTLS